jgi:hypothetical protein
MEAVWNKQSVSICIGPFTSAMSWIRSRSDLSKVMWLNVKCLFWDVENLFFVTFLFQKTWSHFSHNVISTLKLLCVSYLWINCNFVLFTTWK